MNIDNNVLDELVDVIYTRIEQKFAKQLNTANVEYAYSGVVMEIDTDNDTATVDIGGYITEFIPNKTGVAFGEASGDDTVDNTILKVGDTVKVFSDRKNMSGAYIGVKLS